MVENSQMWNYLINILLILITITTYSMQSDDIDEVKKKYQVDL